MIRLSTAAGRILAMGLLLVLAAHAAGQQPYPTKPIRLVVPYPPGGSTDPLARMVAQKMADKWGQQVIVDNRGGGNSIIGTELVAKSPPDGYTLLWVAGAFVTLPSLIPYLPYDTIKDFDGVATFATIRNVLVVHPSVPANTLMDLIALAKSKPGQLNYASSGIGTGNHLPGELLNMVAGIQLQHIPYKGGGPAVADLLSGQVQLSFQSVAAVIAYIKSGKLRPLVICGETRVPALPYVPTFAEAGLPAFDRKDTWHGIVAPAGTPKGIVDKFSAEIARILALSDTQEYLAKRGFEPFVSTPSQTTALIKADIGRIAKIIKFANVRLEK